MKSLLLFCGLLLAAGQFSYGQMYMKAVTPQQGSFNASNPAPSSVGNGFMTVTAIDISGKPIKVTKPTDANSGQFLAAAADKRVFSEVILKFANKDKEGKINIYMTMTLTSATIKDLKQTDSKDVISFDYLKVTTEQPTPAATPAVTPSTTIRPVTPAPVIKKG
jgi:type VI protein secretion system component Hcp